MKGFVSVESYGQVQEMNRKNLMLIHQMRKEMIELKNQNRQLKKFFKRVSILLDRK
jgi:hypothetical protein